MRSMLELYAGKKEESTSLSQANIELRWPGMSQDLSQDLSQDFQIDRPGQDWASYLGGFGGPGGKLALGPTGLDEVHALHPRGDLAPVKGRGNGLPHGTPGNLLAPGANTDVEFPPRALDLTPFREGYQTPLHDVRPEHISGPSVGHDVRWVPPSAWRTGFEREERGRPLPFLGQSMPPTMAQVQQTLIATGTDMDELRASASASSVLLRPESSGSIRVHGPAFGALSYIPWIRDKWGDYLVLRGAEVTSISRDGANIFVVNWHIPSPSPATGTTMAQVQVVVLVAGAILAILALGWLVRRVDVFLNGTPAIDPATGKPGAKAGVLGSLALPLALFVGLMAVRK